MPKESSGQKRTMKRVMHEYKHGELKGGRGRRGKVKSRKQAIAIGMKEAGTSKYGKSGSSKRGSSKRSSAGHGSTSRSHSGSSSRRGPGRPRKAGRPKK